VLGPVPLRILGVLAAVVLLVRRKVRSALFVLACATFSGLVTTGAKSLAGRPRPVTALVAESSTSFPSGHALETTAGVLALLTVVLPMISRAGFMKGRAAVVICGLVAAGWLGIVGAARVALNVHHPSDVIAGWALGYLYFLLCLWIFRPSPRSDPTGSKHLLDPCAHHV
jgi:membrane-associated phospholipid phosphatase